MHLIQFGLDPGNITYEAVFNRLSEFVLANITLATMCALVGAAFYVATLLTRTNSVGTQKFIVEWLCVVERPGRLGRPDQ
jgi:hypothetical protein